MLRPRARHDGNSSAEFPAANQSIERLVALGVLKEITGNTRNRRFRFEEYARPFEDETSQPHEKTKR